jgi:hypothetical protein
MDRVTRKLKLAHLEELIWCLNRALNIDRRGAQMIRRVAARLANKAADILFRAGDRLVRIAYRLDPGNDLVAALEDLEKEARR